MIIKKLTDWWQSLRLYVVADPRDNSVTLSKALFLHLRRNASDGGAKACVFVFRLAGSAEYAFTANPPVDVSASLCDIQVNDKHRCVGFESLCPSVGRILYDYALPHFSPVKLSVSPRRAAGNGLLFYQIHRPNEKTARKYSTRRPRLL